MHAKRSKASSEQITLDFSSTYNDRRARIRTALREIARHHKVTLAHENLMVWTLNVEHKGPLRKSYNHLAEEFWCSRDTAKRIARQLEEWNVLIIDEDEHASGSTAPNVYRLHWDGIRDWFMRFVQRSGGRVALAEPAPGPVHGAPGPGHPAPGPVHGAPPSSSSYFSSSFISPLPPLQEGASGAKGGVGEEGVSEWNSVAIADEPATAGSQATAWDEVIAKLRDAGLRATDYVVAEARRRRIAPEVVCQAAEFYTTYQRSWSKDGNANPGVITFWIRQYKAGDNPTDLRLWPSQSTTFIRTQKKEREHADHEANSRAYAIIRGGRAAKKSEEAISAELKAAGLEWPK